MKYLKTLLFAFGIFMPVMLFAAPVNINKADKQTLLSNLDNISEAQADAIINYRRKEGVIVGLFELYNVKGLGRDFIRPNYNKMTVGDVNWGDKKDS